MWYYFLFSCLLFFLITNINIFVKNHGNTTKLYAKVSFFYFRIPHRKIMDKMKPKGSLNNSFYDVYYNIVAFLRMNKLWTIVHIRIENKSTSVNVYQNALFLIATSHVSSLVHANFKQIYKEEYYITPSNEANLDGYLHLRTTVFNLLLMGIIYLTRRIK